MKEVDDKFNEINESLSLGTGTSMNDCPSENPFSDMENNGSGKSPNITIFSDKFPHVAEEKVDLTKKPNMIKTESIITPQQQMGINAQQQMIVLQQSKQPQQSFIQGAIQQQGPGQQVAGQHNKKNKKNNKKNNRRR